MSGSVQKGFTLIELVVACAILAVLAMTAAPFVTSLQKRAKEHELASNLRSIRAAIDLYKKAADEGHVLKNPGDSGYPPSLEILEKGVEDAKNPDHATIYFIRKIPRDPFKSNRNLDPAETWGLRSYASSADNPRPGKDVFDIHTEDNGIGFNGIPYKEW